MSEDNHRPRRGRPARLSTEAAGNSTALIGLELLKAIAKESQPMPLTEIARAAGMSASRTHRYLSSLLHTGFVQKDEATGCFCIGPATVELGIAAMKRVDGGQMATDIMRDLTKKTGLCSYLCVWGSNGPTVIRSEMGDVETAARMRVGANLSLLTATGKIFLTFMRPEETRALLIRDIEDWNRETPGAEASIDSSMRQSERIEKARIAKTRGMRNPTWTAFSSPVFDPHGAFRMALTVIGVTTHFDTRLTGPVADQLKASAERLSKIILA